MKSNQNSKKVVDAKAVRKQSLICGGGGIVMLAIGAGATALSYDNAKPGGTYTVYTGIIVLGAWFLIKGILGLVYPQFFVKRAEKRAVIDAHEVATEDEKDTSDSSGNKPINF